MKEPLPLARIHDAILEFLRNRTDLVLFGAQAVNAYVEEPRMTQDVDILSTRGRELAEELRTHLFKTFAIAVRTRDAASGNGFRVYQLRQTKNRHLANIRHVASFPPTQLISDIRVPTPEELIAQKVVSLSMRSNRPKGDTDRRDLKLLLLTYPALKQVDGPVSLRLGAMDADGRALDEVTRLVASVIEPEDESSEFD